MGECGERSQCNGSSRVAKAQPDYEAVSQIWKRWGTGCLGMFAQAVPSVANTRNITTRTETGIIKKPRREGSATDYGECGALDGLRFMSG